MRSVILGIHNNCVHFVHFSLAQQQIFNFGTCILNTFDKIVVILVFYLLVFLNTKVVVLRSIIGYFFGGKKNHLQRITSQCVSEGKRSAGAGSG